MRYFLSKDFIMTVFKLYYVIFNKIIRLNLFFIELNNFFFPKFNWIKK